MNLSGYFPDPVRSRRLPDIRTSTIFLYSPQSFSVPITVAHRHHFLIAHFPRPISQYPHFKPWPLDIRERVSPALCSARSCAAGSPSMNDTPRPDGIYEHRRFAAFRRGLCTRILLQCVSIHFMAFHPVVNEYEITLRLDISTVSPPGMVAPTIAQTLSSLCWAAMTASQTSLPAPPSPRRRDPVRSSLRLTRERLFDTDVLDRANLGGAFSRVSCRVRMAPHRAQLGVPEFVDQISGAGERAVDYRLRGSKE